MADFNIPGRSLPKATAAKYKKFHGDTNDETVANMERNTIQYKNFYKSAKAQQPGSPEYEAFSKLLTGREKRYGYTKAYTNGASGPSAEALKHGYDLEGDKKYMAKILAIQAAKLKNQKSKAAAMPTIKKQDTAMANRGK